MSNRIGLFLVAVGIAAGLTLLARADAPAGRYTIANGTVYDTKTKLTWQQAVPSGTYILADAKAYCSGLSLAGTGWRVPTVRELQTIVDESRRDPAIDPTAFPSTPSAWFLTRTYSGVASLPECISFGSGLSTDGDKLCTSGGYVRCVR